MTYGEIEFLDEPDAPTSPPPPRTQGRILPSDAIAVLAWLAAALLAVLAPFRALYSLTVAGPAGADAGGQDSIDISYSIDGWGRPRAPGQPKLGGHAARFGVMLCVCAALFMLLLVLCVIIHRRQREASGTSAIRSAAAVLGVVAPSLLAGALAAIYLSVQPVMDSYGADPDAHASYGAFIWLGLAALGCAIVAAGCQLVSIRAARMSAFDKTAR